MVYLTGDCHGDFGRFSRKQRMRLPFEIKENDFVIICGDMGLLWAHDGEFTYNKKWLSALPFTILWVQGNHENYDMIAEYPICMWHGGKARHIVEDKIILLERGQIFEVEGKSFFTFGGASTHDVQGGILDRSSPNYAKERWRANKSGLPYRVRGESWWEQELPSIGEMQEGRNNLSRAGYMVDYVITHCLSGSMQELLVKRDKDILTDYFDKIEERLQYRHWFCGHYHETRRLDEKHTVLYKDIVALQ
ncbi:MAG: metallophosphatase family protein [Lachnospiraceae bacterium]|nr:metallophosphatase family protein [Lachnospiraceae bacterium]